MSTFDWKQLPSGRARFAGSVRGWDEVGHDTFAVELDGVEVFGELKETFAADRQNFGVAVVSFGYLDRRNVGIPLAPGANAINALDSQRLAAVQQTIVELILAGVADNAPSFLKQYPNSHFTGEITFLPGWCSALVSVGDRA